MLIGLISDTHDNLKAVKKAVELFNAEEVEMVLHAGDHIAPFTVKHLKPLKSEVVGVCGNLDAEEELLRRAYENNGWTFYRQLAEAKLEGKIALIHGTEERIVEALARSGNYDVVVRGHTHIRQKERQGIALVVCPGEACGYLTGEQSVAVLEMPERRVRFYTL